MKEMLTNKLLTGMPDAEFLRLMPLLKPVSLSAGERLAEAGEMSGGGRLHAREPARRQPAAAGDGRL